MSQQSYNLSAQFLHIFRVFSRTKICADSFTPLDIFIPFCYLLEDSSSTRNEEILGCILLVSCSSFKSGQTLVFYLLPAVLIPSGLKLCLTSKPQFAYSDTLLFSGCNLLQKLLDVVTVSLRQPNAKKFVICMFIVHS